ncbi:MAG: hypothetical protein NVSMB67_04970 [Flavisolibacter sp.]
MSILNRGPFFIFFLSLLPCVFLYGQKADFSAPVTGGCAPLIVSFQDLSTGNIKSWAWDFGNGATSTLQNPGTTYFKAGLYTITLTVRGPAGSNTLTKQQYITVYGKPTVDFKVSDSTGCFPLRSQFSDQSIPSVGTANTTWLWDFGDGTQSTAQNPLNVYKAAGNYTITLKLTNNKGCYNVLSRPNYIKVVGGVKSDFSNDLPTICNPPFIINFTNKASGPGTLNYFWDFGDGDSSRVVSPQHIYNKTGQYTVSLTTTSSNGCSDTLKKISALKFPKKPAILAPDQVCVRAQTAFSDTVTPAALSSKWYFGDGTTSDSLRPLKSYNLPGSYTIFLFNTYAYCKDSTSKNIIVNPRPVAAFSSDFRFKCQPSLSVNFKDKSSNAVSWSWDFGDSTPVVTTQNPNHNFTKYGSYDVTLIVTNAFGCTDTLIKKAYIKISQPTISFPNFPLKGCTPFAAPVSAQINLVDSVIDYQWAFGDGSFGNTAAPSHIYPTQGTYNLSLKITTSTGCTVTNSSGATVLVGNHSTVEFTAAPNPICALRPVYFSDKSSATPNQINQWHWVFSDGYQSNSQNPTYNPKDTGAIDVKLIVSNNGCLDSLTKKKYIRVQPPVANFGFKVDCGNRQFIQFSDSSKLDRSLPVTWNWDFGDGKNSTLPNPPHTYNTPGNYKVTLVVSNGSCSDSITVPVLVFKETPNFTADNTLACHAGRINFTATNIVLSHIKDYTWTAGDGQLIYDFKPTATNLYASPGTYSVKLDITDIYNCKESASKTNYIRITGPVADFTSLNPSGCKGTSVNFTDASKPDGLNRIVRWQWDFGDGTSNSLNQSSISHTYTSAGTYSVKLTLTDAGGCTDSIKKIDFVLATAPKADFSADTLACPGSNVNFTNLSTGDNYQHTWNFGNGTTSNLNAPSVKFTTTGYYDIQLDITDKAGCNNSIKKAKYIRVDKPVAQFTVTDSVSSCTPLEVDFKNTSSYYSSFIWNLNGGTSVTANPIQFYVAVGSYSNQLIVTSPGGCIDSISKKITVYDTAGAKVTYGPLSGCTPLNVSLTGFSPGPLTYTWDFGDGTLITNLNRKESHVYYSFGAFIPKIIMTDHSGCVIPVTGADTIQLIGAVPKFGLDKKLLCDSGTVHFLDSTTFNDPIISHNWSFGDGDSSKAIEPTHNYKSPGFYTVSLNIKTQSGCSDTFQLTKIIKIVNSPTFSIQGDSIVCAKGFLQDSAVFARYDTSAVQWRWTFPNGNISDFQNPISQQYNLAGDFVISAIATNSSNCVISKTKSIHINPLPIITMPTEIIKQAGYPITIPATYSSNVVSYTWQPVTNLSCTNCPRPVATNKFTTTYLVSVVDSNSCKSNKEVQVIVTCKNANVFVPNTFSPNGDGTNDIFYVRGRGLERVKSLRIFNRWGQVVFERSNFAVNDPAFGWDGKYKGGKPLADVYIYQLEVFCENSETISFEGNVALIK